LILTPQHGARTGNKNREIKKESSKTPKN
jgi:hypothetical protein